MRPAGRQHVCLAGVAALVVLCGCARIAPFSASSAPSSDGAHRAIPGAAGRGLSPRTSASDPHDLGVLASARDPDSTVVLVYGDNRPGLRTYTRSRVYRFLRYHVPSSAGRLALGIVGSPFFVLESIVPSFDGPRDLVTAFSRRPSGGGERQVLDAMSASGRTDLVISTGDLVQDGRRGVQWEDFVRRHDPLRSRVPYLSTPGNHERLDTALGRDSWNAAMGPPPRPDRYWWSVDLPDSLARFVFVDANPLANVEGVYPDSMASALAQEQLDWVDEALGPAFRFRFVVLHHPLISAGHYTEDWAPAASAARRERLLRICRARGVTAIFAGHEHLYQRVFLRDEGGGGVWHVTTGGGGAPLYAVNQSRSEAAIAAQPARGMSVEPGSVHARSVYHYCRLVLPRDPQQTPTLAVVQVLGNGTGRVIDKIDLVPPMIAR